jgi:formyltetrahydrofolate hydrolase
MADAGDQLYIFTISCPDRTGIVAAVAGFLADHDAFITESSHFGDPETRRFFMRTVFRRGIRRPRRINSRTGSPASLSAFIWCGDCMTGSVASES